MEDLILKYLKEGKTQAEIAQLLVKDGILPNSLSSIEKKLKAIRAKYGANTMFHLGVMIANQEWQHKAKQYVEDLAKDADDYNQRHGK